MTFYGDSDTYTRGFTIGGAGGGRLDVTTSGQTLTVGTGHVTGTGLLTVGGAGNTTINSNLTHTGGLTKADAGTLVLTGVNTYSGATAVSAGKLLVGVAGAGSITSNVTVASGAAVGGDGTITGNVILSAESSSGAKDGGKLVAGNSLGVLTVTGTTTFNTGSIFSWKIDTDTGTPGRGTEYAGLNTTSIANASAVFQILTSDSEGFGDDFWTTSHDWTDIFKNVAGTASLGNNWANVFSSFAYTNGTSALTTPTNGSFSWTNSGNTLTWSAVPEPTGALAGLLLGAGLWRRRRGRDVKFRILNFEF